MNVILAIVIFGLAFFVVVFTAVVLVAPWAAYAVEKYTNWVENILHGRKR